MHDLRPITPLGGTEPRQDIVGPVTVTEVTSVALASVAARLGREDATRSGLAKVLNVAAPDTSRCDGGDTFSAFWTGPDQWMIEAPIETHEDLAKHVLKTLGSDASVTEQTDAWCRFDLKGRDLASVLERLCPANVRAWTGGEVQRSSIDHLGCFVIFRDTETISIIGPRSSAGSLHHALLTACRSAF
ncbi:sarcosine oxidase subunit gamma [Marivita sp. S0852]|uniref:sarcosine oxidase subunit gamma n=1 Tax=Marivita sp. S0852 TaxID=3373893 RepID=UPI003981977A